MYATSLAFVLLRRHRPAPLWITRRIPLLDPRCLELFPTRRPIDEDRLPYIFFQVVLHKLLLLDLNEKQQLLMR
jgi:hypothetical protein